MTDEESASFGNVIRKIYHVLKLHAGAERVYQVTLIEGVPHFHTWLVPHRKEDVEKGMKFLARDDSCSEEDAVELANKLREAMKE
jgi:diadenosine tetraphosphate (Ap4A) HIT family hydrolase